MSLRNGAILRAQCEFLLRTVYIPSWGICKTGLVREGAHALGPRMVSITTSIIPLYLLRMTEERGWLTSLG